MKREAYEMVEGKAEELESYMSCHSFEIAAEITTVATKEVGVVMGPEAAIVPADGTLAAARSWPLADLTLHQQVTIIQRH